MRIVRRTTRRTSALVAACLLVAVPLGLAACSASASQDPAASEADGVALSDGWAKAGDGMTGVFGILGNPGAEPLVLTEVESPVAELVELHETETTGEDARMYEVEGGLEIPAEGSLELVPGGTHIMLMEMPEPLLAGDEVPLTLRFDDGSEVEATVLVKDYAGAEEDYGDGHDSHDGH